MILSRWGHENVFKAVLLGYCRKIDVKKNCEDIDKEKNGSEETGTDIMETIIENVLEFD